MRTSPVRWELRRSPGRCRACGMHLIKQGHEDGCPLGPRAIVWESPNGPVLRPHDQPKVQGLVSLPQLGDVEPHGECTEIGCGRPGRLYVIGVRCDDHTPEKTYRSERQ